MHRLCDTSNTFETEFSSMDSIRQEIEDEQNHFVDALFEKTLIPDGFDHERFQVAASILKKKRMKALKMTWPGLVNSLGCDFKMYFSQYANSRSQPRYQSSLLEGRLFAKYLERENLLCRESQEIVKRFDRVFFVKGKRLYKRNKMQRILYRLSRYLNEKLNFDI